MPIKPACAACDKDAEEGSAYCAGHQWFDMPGADRLMAAFNEAMDAADGTARQVHWECEDGWIVGYGVTKTVGGPNPGKFEVFAYRPTGRGARSGRAASYKMAYRRGYVLRRKAKARAVELYYRHSPKRAAEHGVTAA